MAVIGASSPIKSIQRGTTLSNPSTAVNVTITAVDLDKSFVSATNKTGYTNVSNNTGVGIGAGATLTTTTNLAVSGGST